MKTLAEFNKLKPTYQAFTEKMYDLVVSLLRQNNIKYHLIEHRTKEQLSFASKIVKKNESFDSTEITDISGLRIITYYQKDVDIISQLLLKEFDIDNKNSIDKSEILKSNEFGYQSVHYIVKLKENRFTLTEWSSFKNLKAEIQIRTVLQHAWASISHELQYKKSYEIPDELKRKLYRLSGLFELADEEFGELKEKHISIEKQVFKGVTTENTVKKTEINLITINHFIQTSKIATQIQEAAIKAGFSIEDITEEEQIKSKSYKKSLSEILNLLQVLEISDLNDLETLLNNSLKKAYPFFNEVFKNNGVNVWTGWKDFFVELILIANVKDLDNDYLISNGWSKSFLNSIKIATKKYYG